LADGTHISFDEDGGVSFETSATASGEPVNKELGAFFTRRNQTRLDMMRALIRELADNNGQEITGTELRAAHPEYDSGDQTLYNDLKDIRNLLGESIIFTFNGRYSTYRFEAEPVETGGSSDPEPAPAETPAANPEAERSMEDVKPLRTYRLVDGQHMRFNSDGGVTFEIDGGSDGQPVYCELWTIFGRRSAERLEMMRGLAKRLAENSGVPIQPMDLRSVHPGYETTPPWLVRDLRDLQKVLGESLLSEGWARGSRYTFVGQLIEAEEQPEPSPSRPKRPAAGVAVAKQPTPEAAYPADDFSGENIITRGLLDYNSGLSLLRERAADGRDLFLPVADNFRKVVELIMSRQSSNGILEIDVQQLINEAKQAADKQDKLRTWAEIRSSIIGPLDILSSQFRSIEAIRDPSGDIVQVLVSLTSPEA
jgi:hypothetical protein